MTVKQSLIAARALIDTPDKWRRLPRTGKYVQFFNDHPSTTHADVMRVFDAAIAAQDEKEAL